MALCAITCYYACIRKDWLVRGRERGEINKCCNARSFVMSLLTILVGATLANMHTSRWIIHLALASES
ncbi:uncharacterized protein LY89DRAFT_368396 [Mollisia scopiformis]|uniref:Uncharacterized protein n=1 Tax=Mollisia scopiformis TaxID=149040 RepID=A0A132B447_MOLSC|nr:uncharacterized protein LY89DRAFT_368396 [Mollisia scopiformis]KUJ07111.1 hypothetical protein LY89DRAFT_368396 [Mollisia scopiformis]